MIIAVTDSGLCPGEVKRLGWSFLVAHPALAIPAALTTLYQPNYMDILPVFIWSMAALPAFAWLERRIGVWALAAPVGLYLAAWLFGLSPPSLGPDTASGSIPSPGRSCSCWAFIWAGECWCSAARCRRRGR